MATEHSNQRIIFCIRFNYEMHPLGTSRLDIVDFSLHLCQGTRTTEGVHDTVITDTSLDTILSTNLGPDSDGCSRNTEW